MFIFGPLGPSACGARIYIGLNADSAKVVAYGHASLNLSFRCLESCYQKIDMTMIVIINFEGWKIWRDEKGPVGKIDHDEKAKHLVAANQEKRHWMGRLTLVITVSVSGDEDVWWNCISKKSKLIWIRDQIMKTLICHSAVIRANAKTRATKRLGWRP